MIMVQLQKELQKRIMMLLAKWRDEGLLDIGGNLIQGYNIREIDDGNQWVDVDANMPPNSIDGFWERHSEFRRD